jgi:hypothetical protein
MELGAAWAQGSRSLAVVVPPTDFQSVTKTLGLKQAWKNTDKAGLIYLKQLVTEAITELGKRSEHTWDDKQVQWGVDLKTFFLNFNKQPRSTPKSIRKYSPN